MAKFRKKPVVIEAVQFTEANIKSGALDHIPMNLGIGPEGHFGTIGTLEGEMRASLGDWIIQGVNGEFYPCKPDIFEKTYEPVE
jgi:hypothetical protein